MSSNLFQLLPVKLIRIGRLISYEFKKRGKKVVLTNDPEYSIGENIIPLIFVSFRSSDVSNQS